MAVLTPAEQELVDVVKNILKFWEEIPVHGEVLLPTKVGASRTRLHSTYENWRLDKPIWLYLDDGQTQMTSGTDYIIDTNEQQKGTGQINLVTTSGSVFESDGELLPGREVEAQYKFQYFSDEDLVCLMNLALYEINAQPPNTGYTSISTTPREFDSALIIGTLYYAYQRIIMDSNFWNQGLIYMDLAALRQSAQSIYQATMKSFETNKKFAKPRSMVKPRGVHTGKQLVQTRIDGHNFQSFVLGGSF